MLYVFYKNKKNKSFIIKRIIKITRI
jgi:hypothetical protein